MATKNGLKLIGVLFEPPMVKRLKIQAARQDSNMSEIVRQVIGQWLDEREAEERKELLLTLPPEK